MSCRTRFAFCEAVSAGSLSRWHIRELHEHERVLMTGGGVRTGSLCGHVKPRAGWDLAVPISEHHLTHACPDCVQIYRETQGEWA